jgi:hypothetical protein
MNIDLGEDGALFDMIEARAQVTGRGVVEEFRRLIKYAIHFNEGFKEGFEQALEESCEAKRELFQTLAATRGWGISAAQLARLHATRDLDLLTGWCARVVTASSVDEAMSPQSPSAG